MKAPPPEWALLASRLRLAIRIACRPASFLTAILRTGGGERWRRGVQNACAAMKKLLPGKLSNLPSPLADPVAWEAFPVRGNTW